jgi:hypothetical protein
MYFLGAVQPDVIISTPTLTQICETVTLIEVGRFDTQSPV